MTWQIAFSKQIGREDGLKATSILLISFVNVGVEIVANNPKSFDSN